MVWTEGFSHKTIGCELQSYAMFDKSKIYFHFWSVDLWKSTKTTFVHIHSRIFWETREMNPNPITILRAIEKANEQKISYFDWNIDFLWMSDLLAFQSSTIFCISIKTRVFVSIFDSVCPLTPEFVYSMNFIHPV